MDSGFRVLCWNTKRLTVFEGEEIVCGVPRVGRIDHQDGSRDVCPGSGARSTDPQNVESGTEDRCGGSQAHA